MSHKLIGKVAVPVLVIMSLFSFSLPATAQDTVFGDGFDSSGQPISLDAPTETKKTDGTVTTKGDEAKTASTDKLALDQNVVELENPLGRNKDKSPKGLIDILVSVFKAMRNVMFAIVPIFVVVGAFQMLFSSGNPEKFATGQKTILYAVIGLVVILIANGIVAIVKSILTV
jgi:hypothetical protein